MLKGYTTNIPLVTHPLYVDPSPSWEWLLARGETRVRINQLADFFPDTHHNFAGFLSHAYIFLNCIRTRRASVLI